MPGWIGQARFPVLPAGGRVQCRNGEMTDPVRGNGEEASEVTVTVEWDPDRDLTIVTVEYT